MQKQKSNLTRPARFKASLFRIEQSHSPAGTRLHSGKVCRNESGWMDVPVCGPSCTTNGKSTYLRHQVVSDIYVFCGSVQQLTTRSIHSTIPSLYLTVTSTSRAGKRTIIPHKTFTELNDRTSENRVTVPESSIKHFQSIARRLYRIFAHAYYHHRELFSEFEVMPIALADCLPQRGC